MSCASEGRLVKLSTDVLATIVAGGTGATLAALAVGANLLVVVPVTISVAVFAVATRSRID